MKSALPGHDDQSRLVHADALTEKGDPLGELIQVQIALARLPYRDWAKRDALENREDALLRKHAKAWHAKLVKLGAIECTMRRGFVESVKLPAAAVLDAKKLDAIFAAAPLLQGLELGDEADDDALGALAQGKQLLRFRELTLAGPPAGTKAMASLLGGPAMASIESLRISDTLEVTETIGTAISKSTHLHNLASLTFEDTLLGSVGLAKILDSSTLPKLRHVNAYASNVQDAAATAIGKGVAAKLDRLELGVCDFTPKSAKLVLASDLVKGLSFLALRSFHWKKGTIQALAESPKLKNLRALDLDYTSLDGDAGARLLAAAKNLPKLEWIRLWDHGIGEAGKAALEKRFGPALEWS